MINKSQIKLYLKHFNIFDLYNKSSYSQCGEDIIIDYLINLYKIQNVTYLDIGANHPYQLNNTYLFYKKGCRGINVDANPSLISLFNFARKKDKNINLGVDKSESYLPFYIFKDHTLSTFSEQEAQSLIKAGNNIVLKKEVKVKTLNQIVNEYAGGVFPSILSIDVEGLDEGIIKSTDFSKNKPAIICAETAEYSNTGCGKKMQGYIDYIKDMKYIHYADTNLNSIFFDEELIK